MECLKLCDNLFKMFLFSYKYAQLMKYPVFWKASAQLLDIRDINLLISLSEIFSHTTFVWSKVFIEMSNY